MAMAESSMGEVLHLSYSEAHDKFVREDFFEKGGKVPGSMPQTKLNEKNAIMLNVKDPKYFNEAYEKVIKKVFAK